MLGVNAIRHLVLLNIVLVLHFQLVVRNLDVPLYFRGVQQAITHYPLLRYLVARFVFFVLGFNFRVGRIDLGGQLFGLDHCVVQFYLFVFIAEFVLQFIRPYADSIGYALAKLFFE